MDYSGKFLNGNPAYPMIDDDEITSSSLWSSTKTSDEIRPNPFDQDLNTNSNVTFNTVSSFAIGIGESPTANLSIKSEIGQDAEIRLDTKDSQDTQIRFKNTGLDRWKIVTDAAQQTLVFKNRLDEDTLTLNQDGQRIVVGKSGSNFTIPTTRGNIGQILQDTGSGLLNWVDSVGAYNHFDLINIGQNTHVQLDDFKSDIESKINQSVLTTASPSFANITSGAVQCNSVQSNSVQAGSVTGTSLVGNSINSSNTIDAVGKITASALDLNDNVFSTLNFKRQNVPYWSITNNGGNGDTLVFENANIDQSITMTLTQDSQLKLGQDNPYLLPLNIGSFGQTLVSDGFENLVFKSPVTGRYVQASTASIVNSSNTTAEIVVAPNGGIGQFKIDGDSTSANLDTYVLCVKGQIYDEGKNEPLVIRLKNAFNNILFEHEIDLADVKSGLPGEAFEYNVAISRFEAPGNVDSLRIDGVFDYTTDDSKNAERNQLNTNIVVGSAYVQDLTLTFQFPDDNNNSQFSVTSVIFQRIF
jgi:hypothetical protein